MLCEELDSLAIDDKSKSKESIACSDDLVPIHSSSTSIEDLKEKIDKSISKESIVELLNDKSISKESIVDILTEKSVSKESMFEILNDKSVGKGSINDKCIVDDVAPVHKPVKDTDVGQKCQLNDLLSPVEESISMFTQLSDKLSEMTTEGDSGVDTAHYVSDDETCRPEVKQNYF